MICCNVGSTGRPAAIVSGPSCAVGDGDDDDEDGDDDDDDDDAML